MSCEQDESGATAEERQNDQNAGLEGEGEESRPESRPLLQETQSGMTKASPLLEDEDRGLGDSLPNTTNSSQTSLSGLPTMTPGITPRQSPSVVRTPPAPVDVVRRHCRGLCSLNLASFFLILHFVCFFLSSKDDPLKYRLVPVQGNVPAKQTLVY